MAVKATLVPASAPTTLVDEPHEGEVLESRHDVHQHEAEEPEAEVPVEAPGPPPLAPPGAVCGAPGDPARASADPADVALLEGHAEREDEVARDGDRRGEGRRERLIGASLMPASTCA